MRTAHDRGIRYGRIHTYMFRGKLLRNSPQCGELMV